MSSVVKHLARLAGIVRQVIGAPDYERYLSHARARHPGATLLGRDDFYCMRLEDRYNKPGTKCC